ncbi:MAG: hypothetical protein DSY76_09155 [Bacteroidetes bacterium]|nr:MAG: hypothetical protein DSY76_09155 [Bacteroidota bacterium]
MSKQIRNTRGKFKTLSLKLSAKEYIFLQKCVLIEQTTINKFIKKYMRVGMEELKPRVKEWEAQVQPDNQLLLFDFDAKPEQTNMLDTYEEFYDGETEEK